MHVTSVDELYGHYLDSTMGFIANLRLLTVARKRNPSMPPPGSDDDKAEFFVGDGNPNDPTNRLLHKTTLGEFKNRNSKGGRNHVRAAQLLVVLLYAFWESAHRARIAAALGLKEATDLKIPLFGDLKLLRHDVIHHRGILRADTVTKLSVLRGFQEGQVIAFEDGDIEALVRRIKAAMDDLVIKAGGTDPKHRTIWHVQ